MAKLSVLAGATSQSVNIFIQDSSVTTGAGLTGLAFNTSSLVAYYTFVGTNAAATAITLATLAAVNSAYSSGGFKEIDATNMPGLYRLDLPNAAIATSKGRSCVVLLKGATNMAPCVLEIELTGWDNQVATIDANMTKILGTAVSTPATAGILDVNVKNIDNDAASASGTVTFPGTIASPTNITAGTITTVTNLTNAPTSGDFTSTMKTSIGTAVAASAVASVTGNVGGNVTGSVGSVTGLTASNLDATISSRLASASYTAAPTATQNADALLNRDMSAVSDTNARSPLNALRAFRNKVSVPTGQVFKEDDSTEAWTFSTTTSASAVPITVVDPT